jgi:hypothetical protein
MIKAKARIAPPGIPEIVPEGVNSLAGPQRTQRVSPTLADQCMKRLPHFWSKQGIVDPSFGFIDV